MTNTYLFSWNAIKWPWPTLEEDVVQVMGGRQLTDKWSCSSFKKVKPGDRAFFIKVAHEPKGIFGSGYLASEAFLEPQSEGAVKQVYRVSVKYDVLINPYHSPILTLDLLQMSDLRRQQWTPQSAGISIRPDFVPELEALWNDFLQTQKITPLRLK